MLKLFWLTAFLIAWHAANAPAARADGGQYVLFETAGSLLPAISAADHYKYGFHLSALALPGAQWSPWVILDGTLGSLSTVNAGAAATASTPYVQETHQGSTPYLLRVLVKTPVRGENFSLSAGLSWLFLDIANPMADSIPNAPTLALNYQTPIDETWTAQIFAGLAVNPLGSFGVLLIPEATLIGALTTNLGVEAGVRVPYYRTFRFQAAGGIVPSFSLGLVIAL